jgi:hypothetical protein
MRPLLPGAFAAAALLVACKGGDDSGKAGEDLEPLVTGTITPDGEGVDARFEIYKAFGFDQGGRALLYLSSTPEASCDSVSTYLRSGGDPYDPVEVFTGGTCNMLIGVDATTVGFTGQLDWSRAEGEGGVDALGAGIAIECAMGEGAFEMTQLSETDELDYYWTGRWWTGRPDVYSLSIGGGGGGAYALEFDLQHFLGGFIREGLAGNDPASGPVSGAIEAEWCTDLGTTGLF